MTGLRNKTATDIMADSLQQYIDLYDRYSDVVQSTMGAPVNILRGKAREVLGGEGVRLPRRGDEGFEKTSVDEMFAPDYGVNIKRLGIPVDVAASFRCDVPNLSTLQATVVNDKFIPSAGLDARLPKGVRFMSLARASVEQPGAVASVYGKVAPLSDPAVALNTMLVQDGVLISVADGVIVEKPLQLVNIFSATTPLAAFRRVLIVLGKGARLKLLVCDHTQETTLPYLASQVIEVKAGENSSLEICQLEESTAVTSRYSQLFITQQQGSSVKANTTTLTCGTTRNDFNVSIDGEHCECRLTGMAIAGDGMHIDNSTSLIHRKAHCHSDQLFKYVIDDRASGAFEGSIDVTPDAPFTEAYQSNRNLLASTTARMHCKPQLIINNDEVKCSHGASTGQLDEDALFYMRQRGIPLDEARRMLMQAFMSDVIDSVDEAGLQERLRHLVSRRFAGELGDCDACHKCE